MITTGNTAGFLSLTAWGTMPNLVVQQSVCLGGLSTSGRYNLNLPDYVVSPLNATRIDDYALQIREDGSEINPQTNILADPSAIVADWHYIVGEQPFSLASRWHDLPEIKPIAINTKSLTEKVFQGIKHQLVLASLSHVGRNSPTHPSDGERNEFQVPLWINTKTGQVLPKDETSERPHDAIEVSFTVDPDNNGARIQTLSRGELFQQLRQNQDPLVQDVIKELLRHNDELLDISFAEEKLKSEAIVAQNRVILKKLHKGSWNMTIGSTIGTDVVLGGLSIYEAEITLDKSGIILGGTLSRPAAQTARGTVYYAGMTAPADTVFIRLEHGGLILEMGETQHLNTEQQQVMLDLYESMADEREAFSSRLPYALELLRGTRQGQLIETMATFIHPYIDGPQTIRIIRTNEGMITAYELNSWLHKDMESEPHEVLGDLHTSVELDADDNPVLNWQLTPSLRENSDLVEFLTWYAENYDWRPSRYLRSPVPNWFKLSKDSTFYVKLFDTLYKWRTENEDLVGVRILKQNNRLSDATEEGRYRRFKPGEIVGTIGFQMIDGRRKIGIRGKFAEKPDLLRFLKWFISGEMQDDVEIA